MKLLVAALLLVAASAVAAQPCGSGTGTRGECRDSCEGGFRHADAMAGCLAGKVCCVEAPCGSKDIRGGQLARCRAASECAASEGAHTGDLGCAAHGMARTFDDAGDAGASSTSAPVCCKPVAECADKLASPMWQNQMVLVADAHCNERTLCVAGSECDKTVKDMMVMMHWCAKRMVSSEASYLNNREKVELLLIERHAACADGQYRNPKGPEAGRMTREQLWASSDHHQRTKNALLLDAKQLAKWSGSDEEGARSFLQAAADAAKSVQTTHGFTGTGTVVNKFGLFKVDVAISADASIGASASAGAAVAVKGQVGPDFFHVYASAKLSGELKVTKVGTVMGLIQATGVTVYRALLDRGSKGFVDSIKDVDALLARAKRSFERKFRNSAMRLETKVEEVASKFVGDIRAGVAKTSAVLSTPPPGDKNRDLDAPDRPRAEINALTKSWSKQDTCKEGQAVLAALIRATPSVMEAIHFSELATGLARSVAEWYDVTNTDEYHDPEAFARFRKRIHAFLSEALGRHLAYIHELKRIVRTSGHFLPGFGSMPQVEPWCPENTADQLSANQIRMQNLLDDALKAAEEVKISPPIALRESEALEDYRRWLLAKLAEDDWSEWGPVDAELSLKVTLEVEAGFVSDPSADGWLKALTGGPKHKFSVAAIGGVYVQWSVQPYARAIDVTWTGGAGGGIEVAGVVGPVEAKLRLMAHTDGGKATLTFELPSTAEPGGFVNRALERAQTIETVAGLFVREYQRIASGQGAVGHVISAGGQLFEEAVRLVGEQFVSLIVNRWTDVALSKIGVSVSRKLAVACVFDIGSFGIVLDSVSVSFKHGITASVSAKNAANAVGKFKDKDFKLEYSKSVAVTVYDNPEDPHGK